MRRRHRDTDQYAPPGETHLLTDRDHRGGHPDLLAVQRNPHEHPTRAHTRLWEPAPDTIPAPTPSAAPDPPPF